MVRRADQLRNVQVFHILTLGRASYVDPSSEGAFKLHALFIGPNVREAVNSGRADYARVSSVKYRDCF